MISLSTTWARSAENLNQGISAGVDAGFTTFTADGIDPQKVIPSIPLITSRRAKVLAVSSIMDRSVESVAAPAPSPSLSSPDPEVRKQAILNAAGLASIASSLGSSSVVLSGGAMNVEGTHDLSRQLRREKLLSSSADESTVGDEDDGVKKALELIANEEEPYLDALCRSLHVLTRNYPHHHFYLTPAARFYELPTLAQLELVLSEVASKNLGYWHDPVCCHALEKMGLGAHQSWLEQYATRLGGAYLHDFADLESRGVPGRGEVDYKMVGFYFPRDAVASLWVSDTFSAEELQEGVTSLESVGIA